MASSTSVGWLDGGDEIFGTPVDLPTFIVMMPKAL
jgi:hypothetical protein